MISSTSARSGSPSTAAPVAFPLEEFYALASLPLPRMERIAGEQVPEPYRALLVHSGDMTPTLEQFHERRIHLQVLRSFIRGEFYFREVVLRLDGSESPVEFGANKISLNHFTCTARRLILEEQVPLGTILKDFKLAHTNHPQAFLRVAPDALIAETLRLRGKPILYARRNRLLDPQGRTLSEVIEILPPVRGNGAAGEASVR